MRLSRRAGTLAAVAAGGAATFALIEFVAIKRLWLDVAVRGLWRYLRDSASEIGRDELVLDVGGGDRPHIRADIVCDRYEESWERPLPLLRDRPLVLGDINALPFKDRAIDYIICQHLIEHVPQPEHSLSELARVGKRGLVRTPSPLGEKLVSRDVHRWFVSQERDTLVMRQKPEAFFDEEVTRGLWSDKEFWHFFGRRVRKMETSYRWKGRIKVRVERLHDAPWDGEPFLAEEEEASGVEDGRKPLRDRLRQVATRFAGRMYRQVLLRRPKTIDLEPLLACPLCRGSVRLRDQVTCLECGAIYPVRQGVPVMLTSEARRAAGTDGALDRELLRAGR